MNEQHIVPLYHLELVREKDIPYTALKTIEAAAEVFHTILDSSPVEKLAVIHCNSSLEMIGAEIVAIGSLEMVAAVPVDVFRGAIRNNAASIWVSHNHVDGNVKASISDYLFTERLLKAAQILDIRVEDHLVVGPGAHYSIRDHARELELETIKKEREALNSRLGGGGPVGKEGARLIIEKLLLGKK